MATIVEFEVPLAVDIRFAKPEGHHLATDDPPPSRTPGQAEGTESDVDPKRQGEETIRRRRPSQAEGEDPDGEADDVPHENRD